MLWHLLVAGRSRRMRCRHWSMVRRLKTRQRFSVLQQRWSSILAVEEGHFQLIYTFESLLKLTWMTDSGQGTLGKAGQSKCASTVP
jgi:hypothetical protein